MIDQKQTSIPWLILCLTAIAYLPGCGEDANKETISDSKAGAVDVAASQNGVPDSEGIEAEEDLSSNERRTLARPVSFEPNYVQAYAAELQFDFPMEQPLKDAHALTIEWFGTPEAPKLPPVMTEEGSDYEDLLTLKNLNMAAGLSPATPIPSDHGLYQQLCVSCHGDSGQGRGSVASSQNPYPRNFRKGVFKYKATSRNAKPTRDDLVNTLNRGLNGSQMPRFDYLSDQQRVALAEYVIYLSIRGEFERKLLIFAALELDPYESEDPSPDSRLYDPGSESAEDQIEFATDELTLILDDWIDADEEVDEIAVDVEFPVIGFTPDEKINRQELDASIERGKQLFVGSVAACSKCHGVDGIGTGAQLPDYDDWTKDYTSTANIDPKDDDAVLEMLIRGALPPQPIDPRNLVEGKFRGGDDPVNIYRRIKHGIAGAPMPAAALATSPESLGLSESEMWDLVNFVLSLSRVQM